MTFGTACSGIGAPEVAWGALGWECTWQMEIEPFPCAVLEHHYPGVPNHGDMTRVKGQDLKSVDVFIAGTPCQSFSVAGKRAGLDDAHGVLAFEFLRIASEVGAKWLVWENVPGVLSSDRGRDFGAILGAMAELGYGWAYRILDAQYFGVPQRRRRVFVVGHLGDWRRAAAVLFERQSMSGDPPPGQEAGEKVASSLGAGTTRNGASTAHNDGGANLAMSGANSDCTTPLVFQARERGDDGRGYGRGPHVSNMPSLDAMKPDLIVGSCAPRKLTPRECERLQGFPDDHTRIPWRGAPAYECPDSPRYKAIGNSMAVPVVQWIGERIEAVERMLLPQKNPGKTDKTP